MVTSRKVTRKIMKRKSVRSSTSPESQSAIEALIMAIAQDPSHSPLFLHSSDHPGLSIVSFLLDETNYNDWSIAMTISLDAKNKTAFINGNLPRPNLSSPTFNLWSRCNSMVKSWILNSVSQQIYRSILRLEDASAIWKDLQDRFHMTNLPRTFHLTQRINDLKQGTMDLSAYYTAIRTLWDQIDGTEEPIEPCVCGKASQYQLRIEKSRIIKFLGGLNESYSVVRGQIIMRKQLPSLSEVYHILDQDQSQRNFNNSTISPLAFQISKQQQSASNTGPATYYTSTGAMKSRAIWSFCGKIGHTIEKCYKKHGYPPGLGIKKPYERKFQKPLALAAPVINNTSINTTSSEKCQSYITNTVGEYSKDQLQNLIALCSSKLQHQSLQSASQNLYQGETSNTTSLSNQNDASGIFNSFYQYPFTGILAVSTSGMCKNKWIIDS